MSLSSHANSRYTETGRARRRESRNFEDDAWLHEHIRQTEAEAAAPLAEGVAGSYHCCARADGDEREVTEELRQVALPCVRRAQECAHCGGVADTCVAPPVRRNSGELVWQLARDDAPSYLLHVVLDVAARVAEPSAVHLSG